MRRVTSARRAVDSAGQASPPGPRAYSSRPDPRGGSALARPDARATARANGREGAGTAVRMGRRTDATMTSWDAVDEPGKAPNYDLGGSRIRPSDRQGPP